MLLLQPKSRRIIFPALISRGVYVRPGERVYLGKMPATGMLRCTICASNGAVQTSWLFCQFCIKLLTNNNNNDKNNYSDISGCYGDGIAIFPISGRCLLFYLNITRATNSLLWKKDGFSKDAKLL